MQLPLPAVARDQCGQWTKSFDEMGCASEGGSMMVCSNSESESVWICYASMSKGLPFLNPCRRNKQANQKPLPDLLHKYSLLKSLIWMFCSASNFLMPASNPQVSLVNCPKMVRCSNLYTWGFQIWKNSFQTAPVLSSELWTVADESSGNFKSCIFLWCIKSISLLIGLSFSATLDLAQCSLSLSSLEERRVPTRLSIIVPRSWGLESSL